MALPNKSKETKFGSYNRFESEIVFEKSGFIVEKSAEYNQMTGNRILGSVVFTVYDDPESSGFIDCFKTLKDAKNCIERALS